jgi:uncharacterized repeat protein (TIGR01451 family)
MMRIPRLVAGIGAVALAATASFTTASPAAAQQASPPGAFADAFGLLIEATALGGNVPVSIGPVSQATSSCLPESGPAEDEVLDVTLPPADPDAVPPDPGGQLVTSEALYAAADTECPTGAPAAFAQAFTENLTALAPVADGPSLLAAEVIDAQAEATCEGLFGATDFVGLTITNPENPAQQLDIPADPPPNTVIPLGPFGSIILNEQTYSISEDGTAGTIVVNGVHIIGASDLLRGDIIISHAVAGVAGCAPGSLTPPDDVDAPEITFDKDAAPATARPGETVTYTATINNDSDENDCDVLRFIDHLHPAFELVSTAGDFGSEAESQERSDGGVDVVLSPTDLVIEAGGSATQTFVVRVRADAAPGTYYNVLEIFCAQQGNFASEPLAPVTVVAPAAPPPPQQPPPQQPPAQQPVAAKPLPRTGGASPAAGAALLLLVAGAVGVRRLRVAGSSSS